MNIQLSAAIACGVISEPVEVGDGRRGPKGCKVMTDVIGVCSSIEKSSKNYANISKVA